MARPRHPLNRDFALNRVLAACAVEPDSVPIVKALTHTGKRGRPSLKINGLLAFNAIKATHPVAAMFLTEIA